MGRRPSRSTDGTEYDSIDGVGRTFQMDGRWGCKGVVDGSYGWRMGQRRQGLSVLSFHLSPLSLRVSVTSQLPALTFDIRLKWDANSSYPSFIY